MTEIKPLYWKPAPGIGYSVARRPDGGMTLTFTDLSDATIQHWRDFALEHLLSSDRLTRNLYDLRQIKEIPEKAVHIAIEVDSDPAARNIRLAVVVNNASAGRCRARDLLCGGARDLGSHQDLHRHGSRRSLAQPPAGPDGLGLDPASTRKSPCPL